MLRRISSHSGPSSMPNSSAIFMPGKRRRRVRRKKAAASRSSTHVAERRPREPAARQRSSRSVCVEALAAQAGVGVVEDLQVQFADRAHVREASTAVAAIRSFHHSQFPAARLARERTSTTSACVPARETADTVGAVVRTLVSLRERGVLDQVVVVDAASADGTAQVAAGAGAEVHQEAELLPEAGPVLGKGDAMWRGLSVLSGELVCFLDADTEGFDERFACGLLGPLLCEPGVGLVKGHFRRPSAPARSPWPRAGAGSTSSPRAPCWPASTLSWRRCASRWPVRWPRAARCSSACRSPPATGWRSRC